MNDYLTSADWEQDIEPERYELFAEPKYHFALGRRDFLRIAGGGIVICLLAADADAQERGQRRGRGGIGGGGPPEISAWLHIDETGQVTVYTGKAEVGQNIRTSLSQAVADELRVQMGSIKLVMADTSLVPPDSGTFGSRTTPDMAARLRRMAAAARETLLDLAAEQAQVERTSLVAADGRVTHPPSKKSFPYGELTKGQKLTKSISGEVATTPVEKWKVLGTSAPKVGAAAFVTGRHQYTSDIKLPGMLYGKVLRPPTLRGTLASVDVSAAKQMPGVVAVNDGIIVAVAAPDEFVAEKALAAIKAEWTSGDEPSDATLYDDLKRTSGGAGSGFGSRGGGSQGSIDEGLQAADHKLEAKYTIAYIAHAPLEPRAAVAEWKDGTLTVWTGTQAPFRVRDNLARAFDLAPDKVRVIVPDTGSGYGGKHTNEAATEAARLAKAAGKPVKLVYTRQEEFTWAYFRPAGLIEVNAGVTKEGLITAWDFHNYNSGGSAIRPLYDIPNLRTQSHNSRAPLAQGSYRALAATANHFARESHIDDLAAAVKIDPLEFRLKNLKDERLRSVLEAAAQQFGWSEAKSTENRGIGIAGGSEKGSYVATCAEVAIDRASGKVQVVRAVTAFECGAIVNPDHLKNQVEGCVVMGLGGALFEAVHFDGGKITTDGFSSYRVPRFRDAPKLETVLVNRPDLPSAGAGETPIVAIAPAIGNAIFAATSIRLRSLPMVPEGLKV